MPRLKKRFTIAVKVSSPILVGQDEVVGRRQLIPIIGGELTGEGLHGVVLPGGVDSQIIRPDGLCEVSARYGVRLDDGTSFYVQNDGIRTVPPDFAPVVLRGGFVDPELYYFCTKPVFEIYDSRLSWLREKVFLCAATRLPDEVHLDYFSVEKDS